jgi:two-component system chemotaxis response regulator CheB
VNALLQLIQQFPKNCPATVITQHMPAGFTASFASRLNSTCAPTVVEAQDNMPIQNGTIYLAPGGQNHLTVEGRHRRVCRVLPGDDVNGHAPSVDVLFDSVAGMGDKVVGVLLTGMGRDGATGLGKIRSQGGHTIGQDQASCIVYGMPRIAFEEGAVQQQLPLRKITSAILELCKS